MNSEKGFSLLEVVASIVILSIVLLSFYPFFINAKVMSNSNMERLVVMNLADATLERVKIDQFSYIQKTSDTPSPKYLSTIKKPEGEATYNSANCATAGECEMYVLKINDNDYFIEVKASQNANEANANLISILITVKTQSGKIKYSVEGYVPNAQISP